MVAQVGNLPSVTCNAFKVGDYCWIDFTKPYHSFALGIATSLSKTKCPLSCIGKIVRLRGIGDIQVDHLIHETGERFPWWYIMREVNPMSSFKHFIEQYLAAHS